MKVLLLPHLQRGAVDDRVKINLVLIKFEIPRKAIG